MEVLVTGAAGFRAPHIPDACREDKHGVRLTDVRSFDPHNDGDRVGIADLTDMEGIRRVTERVDAVCHLDGVGNASGARVVGIDSSPSCSYAAPFLSSYDGRSVNVRHATVRARLVPPTGAAIEHTRGHLRP